MKTLKKVALGIVLVSGTIFVIGNTIAEPEPPSLDRHRLAHYLAGAAVDVNADPKGASLSYIATTGGSEDFPTPLSYAVAPEYFAYYVCAIDNNNCKVENYWEYSSNIMLGRPDEGYALQLERLNMTHGAVIYDMAAWQIAVALYGAKENKSDFINYANAQTHFMINGGFSNDAGAFLGQNRAITGGGGAEDNVPCGSDIPCYGGYTIKSRDQAYTFRMVPTAWRLADPFALMGDNTKFLEEYVTMGDPWAPPGWGFEWGDVTWQDWKGITGENAWAHFIGPLQSDYLTYARNSNPELIKVQFQNDTLQNAIKVLRAVNLLQSELGGIYYAPAGTLGNSGAPTHPYEVAIENNASMMAGLLLLEQALDVTLQQKNHPESKQIFEDGLKLTREILYGRECNVSSKESVNSTQTSTQCKSTAGLLPFLLETAWDEKHNRFYTHGYANDPYPDPKLVCVSPGWCIDPATVNAVDANSWTIATLGPEFLDKHLKNAKKGTTHNIWLELQKWGVFRDQNDRMMGVGFDDSKQGKQDIMSAEWTLGAIGMLRAMAVYPGYSEYSGDLNNAIADMKEGLKHLSTDFYPHSSVFAEDVPKAIGAEPNLSYQQMVIPGISSESQGMVYASKRYFIPFGWWANAVPSTASTAWALMEEYQYNPFSFGGHYKGVTVDPHGGHFKNLKAEAKP